MRELGQLRAQYDMLALKHEGPTGGAVDVDRLCAPITCYCSCKRLQLQAVAPVADANSVRRIVFFRRTRLAARTVHRARGPHRGCASAGAAPRGPRARRHHPYPRAGTRVEPGAHPCSLPATEGRIEACGIRAVLDATKRADVVTTNALSQ